MYVLNQVRPINHYPQLLRNNLPLQLNSYLLGYSLTSLKLLENPKSLSKTTFGQADNKLSLHASTTASPRFNCVLSAKVWRFGGFLLFPFAVWVHLWPKFTYFAFVEVSYLWCEPVNPRTKAHCVTKKPMNVLWTLVMVFNGRCVFIRKEERSLLAFAKHLDYFIVNLKPVPWSNIFLKT